MQRDALEDLRLFSQARYVPLSALPGYAFDSRAGQGITVYVIDTGINPNHPVSVTDHSRIRLTFFFQEFRNMAGSVRWLHLPQGPYVEGDSHGHGTCVASKVTSPTFGVAKNADLVVVRLPADPRISYMLAAWGVVAADIASSNMQGRSVVITAVGCE
jgi:cerevisin